MTVNYHKGQAIAENLSMVITVCEPDEKYDAQQHVCVPDVKGKGRNLKMTTNNKLQAGKWAKRAASAAALWLLAGVAIAQGGATDDKYGCRDHAPGTMATEKGASCMPVGRLGDPFVFCREGVLTDCWMAIDPLTGQWKQICKYLNRRWISTYEQICPRAMSTGGWLGQQGAASMTPFVH